MLESTIETKVCDYAKSKGILAYKFTSPNRRSVPDRLFVLPGGETFFIEFKATGKTSTEAQKREQQRLRDQGCFVFECDSIEKGKTIVDWMLYPKFSRLATQEFFNNDIRP